MHLSLFDIQAPYQYSDCRNISIEYRQKQGSSQGHRASTVSKRGPFSTRELAFQAGTSGNRRNGAGLLLVRPCPDGPCFSGVFRLFGTRLLQMLGPHSDRWRGRILRGWGGSGLSRLPTTQGQAPPKHLSDSLDDFKDSSL
jgi:hypothetical protein